MLSYSEKTVSLIRYGPHRAGKETRTLDPFITSEVLYRLSYSSNVPYYTIKKEICKKKIRLHKKREHIAALSLFFYKTKFYRSFISLPLYALNSSSVMIPPSFSLSSMPTFSWNCSMLS